MYLETAQKVIVPQKKIMSRSFFNSGTLIVIISGYIAVQSLFIGRLLDIEEKHKLNIYVRLHIISPALTGGYTGKAQSCIEAWVPTVSIH